jgi:hypothetical protein
MKETNHMSKRMLAVKRTMVLLSMGSMAFGVLFSGDLDSGDLGGCVRNADLADFYQGVGDASIEAFRDGTANIIGSDFDAIVLTPTANLLTAGWDNHVAQQVPLDVEPITANVLRQ